MTEDRTAQVAAIAEALAVADPKTEGGYSLVTAERLYDAGLRSGALPPAITLLGWQVQRLAELQREWRASVMEVEFTTVESIPAIRVVLTTPDPKQEQDGRYAFLCTPGATVQLGPQRDRAGGEGRTA